jgi:hypothetical protein
MAKKKSKSRKSKKAEKNYDSELELAGAMASTAADLTIAGVALAAEVAVITIGCAGAVIGSLVLFDAATRK